MVLNMGIAVELGLAIILTYVPGIQDVCVLLSYCFYIFIFSFRYLVLDLLSFAFGLFHSPFQCFSYSMRNCENISTKTLLLVRPQKKFYRAFLIFLYRLLKAFYVVVLMFLWANKTNSLRL